LLIDLRVSGCAACDLWPSTVVDFRNYCCYCCWALINDRAIAVGTTFFFQSTLSRDRSDRAYSPTRGG